ncbi:CRISPR-associated endonuclease Cas2 [Thiorhodospira sibirica]|uniref:CRISPR-associated endonuclease Cas2 n=1 Tax=Thiorhodospira sibirica TaxID=154347 RepID=UPI00022C5E0F|nr:CRISPR-associated endonuclease Cas2 [Thiorhodospira sibirica]
MSLLDKLTQLQHMGFERSSFVFSYDISDPKNARAVRRCLQRWRMDGQLSVHEAVMTAVEVETLSVELAELIDPQTDRLLVFRLSRRGQGPVLQLSAVQPVIPFAHLPQTMPESLHDGWYVLAYDIFDRQRLIRIQRLLRRKTIFLQRSVYLFYGLGFHLIKLLNDTVELLLNGEDDLRVYPLSKPSDLWFLCGNTPPLAGLENLYE